MGRNIELDGDYPRSYYTSYYKLKGYKSMVLRPEVKAKLDYFKMQIQADKGKQISFADMFDILMQQYDDSNETTYFNDNLEEFRDGSQKK